MRDLRVEIEAAVSGMEGLRGFTEKLWIGGQDVYLKVALFRPRATAECPDPQFELVHVDVTLSAVREPEEILVTPKQTSLESTKTDNARAMVELLCRQADVLLQSGAWDWEALCEAWGATRFEPSGVCQFPAILVGEAKEQQASLVLSPMDAVSRLIRARFLAWRRQLEGQWKRS